MKQIKNVFDFIGQIFLIYGFVVIFMIVFCVLFGEDAKSISTMFAVGNQGLTVETLTLYLFLTVIITTLKCLLFTDGIIKGMPLVMRVILMFAGVIFSVVIFIIAFGWFPVDNWMAWGMFFLCFFICAIVSTAVSLVKEKVENKKLDDALQRLKRGEIDE